MTSIASSDSILIESTRTLDPLSGSFCAMASAKLAAQLD
jgi:hypothetical protein